MADSIYDDGAFFQNYMRLRENKYCANDLVETPVLFEMLPDIQGKRVLDLGCGCGANCFAFRDFGADFVFGIDSSENMLRQARSAQTVSNVEFLLADVEDLQSLGLGEFDVVVSSLMMHYVRDYEKLVSSVASILVPNGVFLFSQEHPVFTASRGCAQWVVDAASVTRGLIVSGYVEPGPRNVEWLGKRFTKYHRDFEGVINPLIRAGFSIQSVREPKIDAKFVESALELSRCLEVPDYLFVKSVLAN